MNDHEHAGRKPARPCLRMEQVAPLAKFCVKTLSCSYRSNLSHLCLEGSGSSSWRNSGGAGKPVSMGVGFYGMSSRRDARIAPQA
jgi:hypothetical protein